MPIDFRGRSIPGFYARAQSSEVVGGWQVLFADERFAEWSPTENLLFWRYPLDGNDLFALGYDRRGLVNVFAPDDPYAIGNDGRVGS